MIGVIAGQGDLAQSLIDKLYNEHRDFCVVSFSKNLKIPETILVTSYPMGCIGAILTFFKKHDVKEIVMAGSVKRPGFKDLKLDQLGVKWFAKIGTHFFKGDDGLLKAVIKLLENEGFCISAPQDFLDDLLTPLGCLTDKKCTHQKDVALGLQVLSVLSDFDIGQAAVVFEGRVVGIEGVEGTEKLLERCPYGILVKAAKKKQTLLVDVPSIGIHTIEKGKCLDGIVLEAGKTQIIKKNDVIDLCNHYGLFLEGV